MYPPNTAIHQYFALMSLSPTFCTAQSQEFSVRWEGGSHKQERMIPQESHSSFAEHGWAEHPMTQGGFQCFHGGRTWDLTAFVPL